jgi:hypothetical protein
MTPRPEAATGRALVQAGLLCAAAAALWTAISVIDLHDGATWRDRHRREGGPLFVRVDAQQDPSAFKLILMLRGVMPAVLLGTFSAVLLIGGGAQKNGLHS